jgi:hypothetical protein
MSSAPDATRSQLFSVMHKLLFCALVAPQSFVSPLVAGQGSQKVIFEYIIVRFQLSKKCARKASTDLIKSADEGIGSRRKCLKRFFVR